MCEVFQEGQSGVCHGITKEAADISERLRKGLDMVTRREGLCPAPYLHSGPVVALRCCVLAGRIPPLHMQSNTQRVHIRVASPASGVVLGSETKR